MKKIIEKILSIFTTPSNYQLNHYLSSHSIADIVHLEYLIKEYHRKNSKG
jgi:hypothetical protein